jgi:hypothetical protein
MGPPGRDDLGIDRRHAERRRAVSACVHETESAPRVREMTATAPECMETNALGVAAALRQMREQGWS